MTFCPIEDKGLPSGINTQIKADLMHISVIFKAKNIVIKGHYHILFCPLSHCCLCN